MACPNGHAPRHYLLRRCQQRRKNKMQTPNTLRQIASVIRCRLAGFCPKSCSVDQPAFPTVVGRVLLGFAFLVMLSAGAMAQNTFLYTNNNASGANTVSAFSVGSNGALTPVAGSPFPTGGTGGGGGFPAINQVAISTARKFIYASNSNSTDISGFS